MRVILYDIYHAGNDRSRPIHAHVKAADTGDLLISATLDYCLAAIKARHWVIVVPKSVHFLDKP